jgi:hypothetical protein
VHSEKWEPVFGKTHANTKSLERRSDPVRSEHALGCLLQDQGGHDREHGQHRRQSNKFSIGANQTALYVLPVYECWAFQALYTLTKVGVTASITEEMAPLIIDVPFDMPLVAVFAGEITLAVYPSTARASCSPFIQTKAHELFWGAEPNAVHRINTATGWRVKFGPPGWGKAPLLA